MQLDWHDLQTNGYPALLRALTQIETVLNLQEQDISEILEYLVSEEPLVSLARPSELREVVAELGHGWRIERQPATSDPPAANQAATTTVDDIDRQMAGVMTIVDRILHSQDR